MTYLELKTQILNTAKRTDLSDVVGSFVSLAHNRITAELEAPDTITQVELDASSAQPIVGAVWSLALPADAHRVRYVYVNGNAIDSWTEPTLISQLGNQGASTFARGYAVQGTNLLLAPGTGDNVLLSYQKRLPMFAADTDTNWTLENYDQLYLYSSLVHLHEYIQNYEQVASSAAMYDAILAQAVAQTETLKQGGVPRIRSA